MNLSPHDLEQLLKDVCIASRIKDHRLFELEERNAELEAEKPTEKQPKAKTNGRSRRTSVKSKA